MPYLINLASRTIKSVETVPDDWTKAVFHVRRLNSCHYELEWEDVTIHGVLNQLDGTIIVDDYFDAFDIEYYTRGGGSLRCKAERALVDYSDLDAPDITDEMYAANLAHQFRK